MTIENKQYCLLVYVIAYVIARAGVKFGINFTSCNENGNFAVVARTAILPSLLQPLVLSQINNIASFVKVKISDFQTSFTMSSRVPPPPPPPPKENGVGELIN